MVVMGVKAETGTESPVFIFPCCYDKSPNFTASNNIHLLAHSFCASEIRVLRSSVGSPVESLTRIKSRCQQGSAPQLRVKEPVSRLTQAVGRAQSLVVTGPGPESGFLCGEALTSRRPLRDSRIAPCTSALATEQ